MEKNKTFQIAFQTERPIDPKAVRALYDRVSWWPGRGLDGIAQVLNHGTTVGVWEDGQLIAFARAVTDGVFRAYIEDVVVDPAYRRQGIAVQMLERLIDALGQIETISLFCSPDLAILYEQLGFVASKNQIVMHRSDSA